MSLPLATGEGGQGVPCVAVAVGRLGSVGNAEVSFAKFLEHLILRAEVVWNYQARLPALPRPWWKSLGEEPDLLAIVVGLRHAA